MRYIQFVILLAILIPAKIFAQSTDASKIDITGLWKGTIYNDTTKLYYRYEIAISKEKSKLTGYSHTWFILDDKQYYGVKKVKIKIEDNNIIIEDDGLIANNYPEAPAKGVKQLNILTLNASDSMMTLTGSFTTNRTKVYSALTGTINLERKNDYWQSALVPHLEELGLVNKLSFLQDDIILKQNTAAFSQTEIKLVKPKQASITQPVPIAQTNIPLEKIKPEEALPVIVKKETIAINKNADAAIKKTDSIANTAAIVKATAKNTVITKEPIQSKENKIADKQLASENKTAVVKKEEIMPPVSIDKKQLADQQNTAVAKSVDVKKANKPITEAKNTVTKTNNIAAKKVETRKTLLQQTVFFKSDSLQLTLYDNGEVDGDTVSVLMNGTVIMPMVGLSTNAVRKTIFINPDEDSIQLVMYAENLGSIPPNTGLLVVKDGKDIYEIRFSGDLQKNAAIIFRRKVSR
jgi:hypothetical protein